MLRVSRPAIRGNTALAQAFAYDYEMEVEPTQVENVVPIGQRRTLLELNEQTCKWPIGDPATSEFYFCGGHSVSGLPYCAYHSRIAYQPPAARRDKRTAGSR